MKLITINDCHIGGPHQIHSHDEIVHTVKTAQHTVAYLGDNYDVANCKKGDVLKIISQKKLIYSMMRPQDIFVRGNHGINCITAPDQVIRDRVMGLHGHLGFFWTVERANKFMAQAAGAGWLQRNLITRPLDSLRWIKPVKLNDNAKSFIDLLQQTSTRINTIICGHTHTPENIVENYNGVKVIMLKRGIQTINLEEL